MAVTEQDFTLLLGDITIGEANTLVLTRPSALYSATFRYTFQGSGSALSAPEIELVSQSETRVVYCWTPDESLALSIPNSVSGSGTLTMTIAYKGSFEQFNTSNFCTKSYPFNAYVPDSMRPSATLSVALVNDNAVLDGWGLWVRGSLMADKTTDSATTSSGSSGSSYGGGHSSAGSTSTASAGQVSASTAAALGRLEQGYTPSAETEAARGLVSSLTAAKPEDYRSGFAQQLEALYQEISGREAFSYDPAADMAFQSYAAQYARQGRAAMRDTMGQAAHLTGGYGSSYAQSAAQQSYQQYLEKLGDVLPQLQSAAYDRYQDAGETLLQRYKLLQGQEQTEYDRWQEGLEAWQEEVAQAQSRYDQLSSRDLKNHQYMLDYYLDKAAAEQKGADFSVSAAVSSTGNTASLSSTAADSLERTMRNYLKSGKTQKAEALFSQYRGRMTPAQKKKLSALLGTV